MTRFCAFSLQPAGDSAPTLDGDVLVLSDASFEQAIKDNEKIAVKFYAPWYV